MQGQGLCKTTDLLPNNSQRANAHLARRLPLTPYDAIKVPRYVKVTKGTMHQIGRKCGVAAMHGALKHLSSIACRKESKWLGECGKNEDTWG